jgi:hypothetical protein
MNGDGVAPLHIPNDHFSNPAERHDAEAADFRDRGIDRPHQKRAPETDILKRPAFAERAQALNIEGKIREFRHGDAM